MTSFYGKIIALNEHGKRCSTLISNLQSSNKTLPRILRFLSCLDQDLQLNVSINYLQVDLVLDFVPNDVSKT